MKKIITLIAAAVIISAANATEVQLIVQKMDNHNAVPGNTYRIYAQMPDAQHSLHIVFGDTQDPLTIESTAGFFQHSYGSNTALSINDAAIQASPALQYDSYITLGYTNGLGNSMASIGMDVTAFDNGGNLSTANGAWYLLPTDAKCLPANNGLVLIAQFTTTGIVTGTLNLSGWSAPQQIWQEKGLRFSTTNAQVFGCTEATATNYNAAATFNDGTCAHNGSTAQSGNPAIKTADDANSWEVFPNPLHDNTINIQFKNAIDFKTVATTLEIFDMTGRLLLSQVISADSVTGGNRVTLTQDLAVGTYQVVLTQADKQESQTLVVQK